MKKKELYASPQSDVLELDYAEPVCQNTSGSEVPDYDYSPLVPGDLFASIL